MDVQSMTNCLNRLYNDLNQIIFINELTKVEITIASQGKRSAYGWYTTGKIWTSDRNEINMCSEYLDEGLYEIANTLIHEMVHHYNNLNGIKDCSRGGTYHNKNFKAQAEKRYLSVTKDEKNGYAYTDLTETGKKIIDSLNYEDIFKIKRKGYIARLPEDDNDNIDDVGKVHKIRLKYTCPLCNTTVRATDYVDILCGKCSTEANLVQMIIV